VDFLLRRGANRRPSSTLAAPHDVIVLTAKPGLHAPESDRVPLEEPCGSQAGQRFQALGPIVPGQVYRGNSPALPSQPRNAIRTRLDRAWIWVGRS